MKKTAILFTLLAILFVPSKLRAQVFQDNSDSEYWEMLNTVSTSVPFLLIAPDSRSGSMGDVGAATSPDNNSIHWNASKLAFMEESNGLSVSYTPWMEDLVDDIFLGYVSGYKKLNDKNALGASMRYFSLGEINFTNDNGDPITTFSPNEFTFDAAYAMKLSENFSSGLAMRYIYSNLTGGINVQGSQAEAKPGTSFAVDLSSYYQSDEFDMDGKTAYWAAGLNISNIGNKISYTDGGEEHFIPTNGRLGASLFMELDDYNSISFAFDVNKLLVPTPPVYYNVDGAAYNFGDDGVVAADLADGVADSGDDFEDDIPADSDNPQSILAGKDPNVGTLQGMFQSFSDAPGGAKEEFNELMYSAGVEYWYMNQFAVRGGYFHEHETKGNRKYFTIGFGYKMSMFSLDMAYLVQANRGQKSPLANTMRFSMIFDMNSLLGPSNNN